MAKRFTDTELWDKEWFMSLSPKLKCLVKFVRDKADLCGVWSPNWKITNAYIGEICTEDELFSIDNGQQFYKIASGKIFCLGFIEFQYGQLSLKSPVHRKILTLLKQNDLLETYQNIPYQYPINRVQEEEEEEEKEKDKEEEKEKPAQLEFKGLVYPFSSENFKVVWTAWKDHLRECKKPMQTFSSEQAGLQFLSQFTEQYAIDLIKNCIKNNWKNLIDDKKDGKQGNRNSGQTSSTGLVELARQMLAGDNSSNNFASDTG